MMTRTSAGDADSDCSMATSSSRDVTPDPVFEEMRVLAVDDSPIDRKLIEMLLRTSSFTVTAVGSVMRALEVLGLSGNMSPRRRKEKGLEFDLIVTDYCMPEMTGYDLLKRVKSESSPWKDIPVVIMSSENVSRRINRCMAEGAHEFLIKPVQLADVRRLICHVREAKELRGDGASSASSSKRKGTPSTNLQQQGQSLERRARLNPLTVA